jgi:GalNAc-alpha-(1->4)-GalNAc-alpha-(1->3)-diNAcBac-PP-undecaprenol alpha-1,4-N-acetyl-D-galactosaminyltransferase
MKVILVIGTLDCGGAERIATTSANFWAATGWAVTILTTQYAGQRPCYDLHPYVSHFDLESPRFNNPPTSPEELAPLVDLLCQCTQAERDVLISHANQILRLRGAMGRAGPDVVISYMDRTNICVLAAARGLGLQVIATEHSDQNNNFLGDGWERLRRRLYPHASYVTVLTDEALDYFSTFPGIRCRVIPNAVTPPLSSNSDQAPLEKNGRTLIALGRLCHEKGFDLLLQAFALVAERHPDWTLEIVGEGPVRPYLESCVQKRGLSERVRMPGFTRRPFDAMRRADLFVLSSLDEGFPNVLIEAMACGLAVVSFDCPSGPRHIIRDGIDGVLVPPRDAQALAAALDHLMGDEAYRRRLASKAPEVLARFGLEKVMSMFEELIIDCARPGVTNNSGD